MGGGGTSGCLFVKEGSLGWPGTHSKSWSSVSLVLDLQDEHPAQLAGALSFGTLLRFF